MYSFFVKTTDGTDAALIEHLSSRLKVTLNRISDGLILSNAELEQLEQEGGQEAALTSAQDKVLEPRLSPAVNLMGSLQN